MPSPGGRTGPDRPRGRSWDQHHRAGRRARLEVAVRLRGVGERVAAADRRASPCRTSRRRRRRPSSRLTVAREVREHRRPRHVERALLREREQRDRRHRARRVAEADHQAERLRGSRASAPRCPCRPSRRRPRTPWPPVSSRTRATKSSLLVVDHVRRAVLARELALSSVPAVPISWKPSAFAHWQAIRPTPPAAACHRIEVAGLRAATCSAAQQVLRRSGP